MRFLLWPPKMRNVATLTVTVMETCPYSLTSDLLEQTVVLTEDVKTGLIRRIEGPGRNCSLHSHRAELSHWFAGGDLPADARLIDPPSAG